jgi:hypothetical protein
MTNDISRNEEDDPDEESQEAPAPGRGSKDAAAKDEVRKPDEDEGVNDIRLFSLEGNTFSSKF